MPTGHLKPASAKSYPNNQSSQKDSKPLKPAVHNCGESPCCRKSPPPLDVLAPARSPAATHSAPPAANTTETNPGAAPYNKPHAPSPKDSPKKVAAKLRSPASEAASIPPDVPAKTPTPSPKPHSRPHQSFQPAPENRTQQPKSPPAEPSAVHHPQSAPLNPPPTRSSTAKSEFLPLKHPEIPAYLAAAASWECTVELIRFVDRAKT